MHCIIVQAYMEDHLNNKGRLEQEWEALCAYKAENVSTKIAGENPSRNRSQCALPCKYFTYSMIGVVCSICHVNCRRPQPCQVGH